MNSTQLEQFRMLLGAALAESEGSRQAWLAAQEDVDDEVLNAVAGQLRLLAEFPAGLPAARPRDSGEALQPGDAPPTVLRRIEARGRNVSPVRLRSVDESSDSASGVSDGGSVPGEGPTAQRIDQYQIRGEIARGGVGKVLRGRDLDLGRDVALKVMHEDHAHSSAMVQRFVEEAQIGGQLQHPGIVPVYDLGLHGDQQPYFTMKLVKGRTLAELIGECEDLSRERFQFLGVFEQVCQTVAYAHARGVLHRDLKPANIMVGAFGEVQVVDWGMAKVLDRGNGTERPAEDQTVSVIATVRSDDESGSSDSLAGSVLGTPAYMSPEQARGAVDELDPRSDVFSLGAILHEILTGSRSYEGRTSQEVLERASAAELGPAHARLRALDVHPDLVAIALDCLAADPEDRPRNAQALSERVSAFLVGVAQREQDARVQVTATRRTQRMLGVVALAILVGLGATLSYWRESEAQRTLAVQRQAELEERNETLEAVAYARELNDVDRALREGRRMMIQGEALDALSPERRGFAWRWLRTRASSKVSLQNDYVPTPDAGYCFHLHPDSRSLLFASRSGDVSQLLIRAVDGSEPDRLLPWSSKFALFHPGGEMFLTVEHDGGLVLHDLASGAEVARAAFGGSVGPPAINAEGQIGSWTGAATFAPDGTLYVGGEDGSLRRFDGADLSELDPLPQFDERPVSLAVIRTSRDGSLILVGDLEGVARVVDASTGALLHTLQHEGRPRFTAIRDADFSPDGRELLLTGGGGVPTLWDLTTGERLRELEAHRQPENSDWTGLSARFSPDGRLAMTSGLDNRVRLYTTANWTRVAILGTARMAFFSADGSGIIGQHLKRSRLWSLEKLMLPMRLGEDCPGAADVRLSRCGNFAYVVANGGLRKWDLRSGAHVFGRLGQDDADSVAVSEDDSMVALGRLDHRIALLDSATGDELRMIETPKGIIGKPAEGMRPVAFDRVVFSPGRETGLIAAAVGTTLYPRDPDLEAPILLFDVETGAHRATLPGHLEGTRDLAFSPDGTLLASVGDDSRVVVWDLAKGSVIWDVLDEEAGAGYSVRFTPEGRAVLTGHLKGNAIARDVADGTVKWNIQAHRAALNELELIEEGRRLVTIGHDRFMRVWDVASRQVLLEVPLDATIGRPHTMDVSADGQRVVIGHFDTGYVGAYDVDVAVGAFELRRRHRDAYEAFRGLGENLTISGMREALSMQTDMSAVLREDVAAIIDGLRGDTYAALRTRAHELRRRGDHGQGLELLRQGADDFPDNAMGPWWMGNYLERIGRYAEAKKQYERALELDPEHPEAHTGLAKLAACSFDRETALVHAEKALEGSVDYVDLQELAWVHSSLGDLDQAVQLAERSLTMNPGPRGESYIGVLYANHREVERARARYLRALELDPEDHPTRRNLAALHRQEKDFERGIPLAREAAASAMKECGAELGVQLLRAGQPEEALAVFDSSLKGEIFSQVYGYDQWAWYGEALCLGGRHDEARRLLSGLTAQWSVEPYAWHERAWLLATGEGLTEDDRRQGLACAKRAVELSNRRGPVMLATLAEAQFRNGDSAAALLTAEEVLTLMDGKNAKWLALEEMEARIARYRQR